MPYASNKSADQSAHPRRLISAFIICSLGSLILLLPIDEISRLLLLSVVEQAGLSLTWSQTPKADFLVTRLNSSNKSCRKTNATQASFNKHARVFTPQLIDNYLSKQTHQ